MRGLKYQLVKISVVEFESHPSRGAWIEIGMVVSHSGVEARRTPHGVRGLKYDSLMTVVGVGRTPHGVRGLK